MRATGKNSIESRRIRAAFTLIELLVVIAIIAVLLGILIPSIRAAREHARRAYCLNNLKQLTMAWLMYADDHGGRLVDGKAFRSITATPSARGKHRAYSWLGAAFSYCESRSQLIADPWKGLLWPYVQDVDAYRCLDGWKGLDRSKTDWATYAIVSAANHEYRVEGTYVNRLTWDLMTPGVRVGRTMLRLTRLSDIAYPGPGQRAVFIDQGYRPLDADFYVTYLDRKWYARSAPPIHHSKGVTLSMADGHAEYWKWNKETVEIPRNGPNWRRLEHSYVPQTPEGLADLERLQRATWGRLSEPEETTAQGP